MIGPSSTHTAGAARIGFLTHQILSEIPKTATIIFHGSFAETYKGHGTDLAIVAGLLGFKPDDERIRNSMNIARKKGMKITFRTVDLGDEYHSNTAKIIIKGKTTPRAEIIASSIGGGNIIIVEINGFKTELTGDYNTIITLHKDKPGIVANVTGVLSKYRANIASMNVSRKDKGRDAFMAIEIDGEIPNNILKEISSLKDMKRVRLLEGNST
jgi:L-serine dehydratase